jgi:hypothetical protein
MDKTIEEKSKDLQKIDAHFKIGFNVVPQREELIQSIKTPDRCPIEFWYTQDKETGQNALNGQIINVDRQTPEIFSKAITDITGIVDIGLAKRLCVRAADAMPDKTNEALSLILQSFHNSKPKNATEAGLCAQVAILEAQGMAYLQRAENADMLHHRESLINIAIKLLRLQHETIEALNRLRRGNEQKIIVQHQNVQVNDGGKAIIGSQLISTTENR